MKNVELIKGWDYFGHGIKAYKGKPVAVQDDKAKELIESGFFKMSNAVRVDINIFDNESQADDNKVPAAQDGDVFKEVSIDKMKTAELEAYAQEHEIDISSCKTNAERIAVIKAVMAKTDNERQADEDNATADFSG